MNDRKKKNDVPPKPADQSATDTSNELSDSELEDVAGGISWHGNPGKHKPTARWEKSDEW